MTTYRVYVVMGISGGDHTPVHYQSDVLPDTAETATYLANIEKECEDFESADPIVIPQTYSRWESNSQGRVLIDIQAKLILNPAHIAAVEIQTRDQENIITVDGEEITEAPEPDFRDSRR